MDCPKCHSQSKVLDNRAQPPVVVACIKRTRKCLKCGHKFHTLEICESDYRQMKKGKDLERY